MTEEKVVFKVQTTNGFYAFIDHFYFFLHSHLENLFNDVGEKKVARRFHNVKPIIYRQVALMEYEEKKEKK